MRSKKAKKFIESNTLDLENDIRMDTTGYVSHAVSAAKAYGAIEIAEQEMSRTLDAIHISLCPYKDDDNNCYNELIFNPLRKCTNNCYYIKKFREFIELNTEIAEIYMTAINDMVDLKEINYKALRELSKIGIPVFLILKESRSFDDFLEKVRQFWNVNKENLMK